MQKYLKNSNSLLFSIIFILIGIITLIGSVPLFKSLIDLILIVMTLLCLKDFISLILKKNKDKSELVKKIVNLIILILAYVFRDYSIAIVPILFSLYLLFNAFVKIIYFILLKVHRLRGGFKELLIGLSYLIIGVIIFFSPLIHLNIMLNIIGIYSILLGISYLFDYLDEQNIFKFTKFKICLPTIIETLIPVSVLQRINKKMNEDEDFKFINKKNSSDVDLEILIHVTEDGFGRLGHMDMYFDGNIISFGNYDISSYKLANGVGNGILFMVNNRNKYIKFCIKDTKKTLFVFGLKLTEKEKNDIRKNLNVIKENLKPWDPPYVSAKRKKLFIKKDNYKDYSSRLYRATKAKFYKFKVGRFKLFYVLGSNCCSFVNKVISKPLKNSFKLYGILTPGTYYDYLEKEFMKKGSIVVSKNIYSKNNLNDLK